MNSHSRRVVCPYSAADVNIAAHIEGALSRFVQIQVAVNVEGTVFCAVGINVAVTVYINIGVIVVHCVFNGQVADNINIVCADFLGSFHIAANHQGTAIAENSVTAGCCRVKMLADDNFRIGRSGKLNTVINKGTGSVKIGSELFTAAAYH